MLGGSGNPVEAQALCTPSRDNVEPNALVSSFSKPPRAVTSGIQSAATKRAVLVAIAIEPANRAVPIVACIARTEPGNYADRRVRLRTPAAKSRPVPSIAIEAGSATPTEALLLSGAKSAIWLILVRPLRGQRLNVY